MCHATSPAKRGGEERDRGGHGRDDCGSDGNGIGWYERGGSASGECAAASAAAAARRRRTLRRKRGGVSAAARSWRSNGGGKHADAGSAVAERRRQARGSNKRSSGVETADEAARQRWVCATSKKETRILKLVRSSVSAPAPTPPATARPTDADMATRAWRRPAQRQQY